ncbi:zinc ribbon domain-containing protein [Methanobrevibacter sp.]|uniref:zinc ribbon domain-containing protein n=1 Tax=Methanobrevibacter sp. TaxID=66852 RepID=UPI00388D5351
MSKKCPTCGKRLPNGVQFCPDCGHSFNKTKIDIFSNGKILIILIVAVLVIGGIFILTSSTGGDNGNNKVNDDGTHVFLTITDVSGWDTRDGSFKSNYMLYTSALFTKVPDDIKGYMIKTTYYDKNSSQIGQETESLEQIYYDSDNSISFGHYTTSVKPDPDYVVVQIIKDENIIDNYTEKIDQSKIDYLN